MRLEDSASGYDLKTICAFCVAYLSSTYLSLLFPRNSLLLDVFFLVTAGQKPYLRTQSMAQLKNYMLAYNIKLKMNALEKDDLINAIISARVGLLPFICDFILSIRRY